ncbi:MAG: phage baseplate assembly protein V [Gammaproteobacteria bacterium]|nr:phage baseplate assembly protein V [Gammaproteobacteria bacterium]NNJ83520.1 phage baseplate assembly protein V [Gammaproteobacteria bacterium]
MSDEKKQLSEQRRRLFNLIQFGTVVDAKYEESLLEVRIGPEEKDEEKESISVKVWLPWLQARAGHDWEWWAPEIDEQVMILSPGGDVKQGIVIGGFPYKNDKADPKIDFLRTGGDEAKTTIARGVKVEGKARTLHQRHYEDGTVISYDKSLHLFKAVFAGDDGAKKPFIVTELDAKTGVLSLRIVKGVKIDIGELDDKAALKGDPLISLDLDSEGKKITLMTGECELAITPKEELKLAVDGKLTMAATGDVGITTDGNLNATVTGDAIIKADGDITLEGANVTIKSSGDFKVDAGGNVEIKGSAIEMK